MTMLLSGNSTAHQSSPAQVGAQGEFTGDKDRGQGQGTRMSQAAHLPQQKLQKERLWHTTCSLHEGSFSGSVIPCHVPSDIFLTHSLPVLSINLKPFGADIFLIACLYWQRSQLGSPESELIIPGLPFPASSTVFFFKSASISEHESGNLHIALLQKCLCF